LSPQGLIEKKSSALLLRFGGLGDLLAVLPSLRLLRDAFPGFTLHLLGRRDYGELFLARGVVDEVHSADDVFWLPLFDRPGPAPAELAGRLSRYDFVVGWFTSPAAARPFLGERAESPLSLPWQNFIYNPASGLSVSRFFFEATRSFTGRRAPATATFEGYGRLPGASAGPRARFAVIHPGSGAVRKCWPLDRFLDIVSFLGGNGFAGAIVTGDAEERLDADLASAGLPPGWHLSCRPSLAELARTLESAALYIGNDSGVTHLAAACGTPVVALFLKENEAAWRPYGRPVVLAAATMNRLSVREVREAITRTSVFSPVSELC
jgi:heptosyltransferase III